MNNRKIEAAWAYHNATKHSQASIRADRHHLDWLNQPLPFKVYSDLKPIPLPQHLSSSEIPALDAIGLTGAAGSGGQHVTPQSLAEILFLSAGVTRRRMYAGGEMLFRAAACTGALYHIDLYVICDDLDDLAAGIYHFSPQDFALRCLRRGNYRGNLVETAGGADTLLNAPCAVVSVSTFWRNAWKYRARAYRHCYWDNGTILANLMAAAGARSIPANLIFGFVDAEIRMLLGLDDRREAPLSIIALGGGVMAGPALSAVEPLDLRTEPLSRSEIDYPQMRAMHEASSLHDPTEVRQWREIAQSNVREEIPAKSETDLIALQLVDPVPPESIETVILRRGSTRQFERAPIRFGQLSGILDRATRGIESDILRDAELLCDIYLIVHAVDGLAAGAYRYHRRERALDLLRAGDFRQQAGELGLGQEIPEDCSVNVYFLADLHYALNRFGNRGYRAAQLEAAIMGGKMYLAAYAQRLGASGLTFFDDDVTEFFSPDSEGKSVMFLIALGRSVKRA